MRRHRRLIYVCITGFALVCAAPASAQEGGAPGSTGYGAVIDNIDLLLDNYANFLARKYDLTDDQDAYTRQMLRERAYGFLDEHEGDLRDLVDRLFEVRTGGAMDDHELVEWGARVTPIYEKARDIIVQGNTDWREILSESQKRIHDEDLKLMYNSFKTTEEQIDRIVSGQMTVDEFRNPRRFRSQPRSRTTPPRPTDPPGVNEANPDDPPPGEMGEPGTIGPDDSPDRARPPRSRNVRRITPEGGPGAEPRGPDDPGGKELPQGEATRDSRHARTTNPENTPPPSRTARRGGDKPAEGEWERYVKDFIAKYQLNDEQTQQANAVLEDCKKQADQYTRSRQSMIDEIDKRTGELKESKEKEGASERGAEMSKLAQRRTELLAPIAQIFERQLKPKLEKLPTRAQRRAAADAEAKKTDDRSKHGRRAEKKPEDDD